MLALPAAGQSFKASGPNKDGWAVLLFVRRVKGRCRQVERGPVMAPSRVIGLFVARKYTDSTVGTDTSGSHLLLIALLQHLQCCSTMKG